MLEMRGVQFIFELRRTYKNKKDLFFFRPIRNIYVSFHRNKGYYRYSSIFCQLTHRITCGRVQFILFQDCNYIFKILTLIIDNLVKTARSRFSILTQFSSMTTFGRIKTPKFLTQVFHSLSHLFCSHICKIALMKH